MHQGMIESVLASIRHSGRTMKYAIIGTDREKGENVELIVQAISEDEAIKKARQYGILVATCTPHGASEATIKSKAAMQNTTEAQRDIESDKPMPISSTSERLGPVWFQYARTVVVIFGLLAAVIAVLWFTWLGPRNEETARLYRESAVQYDQIKEMSRKSQERISIREYAERLRRIHELANVDRPDIVSNPPPTRIEAMEADSIILKALNTNPGLEILILNNDERWLNKVAMQMLSLNQLTEEEVAFILQFAKAIQNLPN